METGRQEVTHDMAATMNRCHRTMPLCLRKAPLKRENKTRSERLQAGVAIFRINILRPRSWQRLRGHEEEHNSNV